MSHHRRNYLPEKCPGATDTKIPAPPSGGGKRRWLRPAQGHLSENQQRSCTERTEILGRHHRRGDGRGLGRQDRHRQHNGPPGLGATSCARSVRSHTCSSGGEHASSAHCFDRAHHSHRSTDGDVPCLSGTRSPPRKPSTPTRVLLRRGKKTYGSDSYHSADGSVPDRRRTGRAPRNPNRSGSGCRPHEPKATASPAGGRSTRRAG